MPIFSRQSTTGLCAWEHGKCPLSALSLAAIGWVFLGGFGFGIAF
jgi:hypothetical protein